MSGHSKCDKTGAFLVTQSTQTKQKARVVPGTSYAVGNNALTESLQVSTNHCVKDGSLWTRIQVWSYIYSPLRSLLLLLTGLGGELTIKSLAQAAFCSEQFLKGENKALPSFVSQLGC